jgi:hypothetical protein
MEVCWALPAKVGTLGAWPGALPALLLFARTKMTSGKMLMDQNEIFRSDIFILNCPDRPHSRT